MYTQRLTERHAYTETNRKACIFRDLKKAMCIQRPTVRHVYSNVDALRKGTVKIFNSLFDQRRGSNIFKLK